MENAFSKRILLSYDIPRGKSALRVKVCRMVFGSTSRKATESGRRTYRYRGILDTPGAQYVGQSVLLLSPESAERFVTKLQSLGVKHDTTEVLLPNPD